MKNITVIKRTCLGVVALFCMWAGFSVTRLIINSEAAAATSAVAPDTSLFSAIKQRRYIGSLYDRVVDNPDQITTLFSSDFRKMFKDPELKRHEGNLTVWQYRSDRCVLDLYFKGDETQPIDYVLRPRNTAYFTKLDQKPEMISDADCLETIISM